MTRMTVNGEPIHYKLDPETPLLWALRDASNLTGTKYGCDSRDCGACTVIVDGQAMLTRQLGTARPSMITVQAPQSPLSQPYLVPVRFDASRSAHNKGISGSSL